MSLQLRYEHSRMHPGNQRPTNLNVIGALDDTRHSRTLEDWRKEIRRRIIVSEDSGSDFLRKYVPSRTPCSPPGEVTDAFAKFAKWVPQEEDTYFHLVRLALTLVAIRYSFGGRSTVSMRLSPPSLPIDVYLSSTASSTFNDSPSPRSRRNTVRRISTSLCLSLARLLARKKLQTGSASRWS